MAFYLSVQNTAGDIWIKNIKLEYGDAWTPWRAADEDVRIMNRGRTTAAWSLSEEVLVQNETGLAEDAGPIKQGDGATPWDGLPYINQRPAVISAVAPTAADDAYAIGDAWIDSDTGALYTLFAISGERADWKRVVTFDDLVSLGAGDMLKSAYATDANLGDTAIAQDTGDIYRLVTDGPTDLSNWRKTTNGADGVTSWAGRTGAVEPTTSDVTEGTNLYFTAARATANFDTNFPNSVSTDLSDGATILHTTDTLIFDCNPTT
jgi:hypothetical protein